MTPHPTATSHADVGDWHEATHWGSPGAGKPHAGKYGESTPSRQRGGGGWKTLQPPPYPLKTFGKTRSELRFHFGFQKSRFVKFKTNKFSTIHIEFPKVLATFATTVFATLA